MSSGVAEPMSPKSVVAVVPERSVDRWWAKLTGAHTVKEVAVERRASRARLRGLGQC